MLKVKFCTTFFWKQNKTKSEENYHYFIQLHLFLFFLKRSLLTKTKRGLIRIRYMVQRKKQHDTMLLKASFKHKVPKHILTKQINKAFFEVLCPARYAFLHSWDGFDDLICKYTTMSTMFYIPGTQADYISAASPININKLIFINV